MSAYTFAKKNWLEQPPEYSFSKFSGRTFLDAFVGERKDAIAGIEKKLGEITKPFNPAQISFILGANTGRKDFFDSFPKEIIYTGDALKACILAGSSGKEKTELLKERKVYDCLSGCIKSFEVSKKIFSEYGKEFKISTARGAFDKTENYAFLSIACLLFYEKTPNLKFLNAALKLNDFLCSLSPESLSRKDAKLCLYAFLLEKKQTGKLFSEKGVPLWQ